MEFEPASPLHLSASPVLCAQACRYSMVRAAVCGQAVSSGGGSCACKCGGAGAVSHPRSRGFSLIEILVSIVVITILAMILVPATNYAREAARTTACASNLRMIGTGIALYASDHAGVLVPAAQHVTLPNERIGYWYEALEPYLIPNAGASRLRLRPDWQLCPSKHHVEQTVETVGYGWNYGSFGHYERLVGSLTELDKNASRRLEDVSHPADTIIAGDSKDIVEGQRDADAFENRYLYRNRLHASRHNGGGNYLFVDGHVEWLRAPADSAEMTIFSRLLSVDPTSKSRPLRY